MSEDPKFRLEGEIESDQKKDSGENTLRKKRKNRKPLLLLFIFLTILFAIATAFFAYQWFNHQLIVKDDQNVEIKLKNTRDSLLDLIDQNDSLQQQINAAIEKINRLQEFSDDTSGVFFEVQIGNFKDFNLDQYLEEMANLRQEKHDGRNKLLLGKFRSLRKALLFENDLRRIGLRDVFLKGRIDGRLVSKEEAITYLKKEE